MLLNNYQYGQVVNFLIFKIRYRDVLKMVVIIKMHNFRYTIIEKIRQQYINVPTQN